MWVDTDKNAACAHQDFFGFQWSFQTDVELIFGIESSICSRVAYYEEEKLILRNIDDKENASTPMDC